MEHTCMLQFRKKKQKTLHYCSPEPCSMAQNAFLAYVLICSTHTRTPSWYLILDLLSMLLWLQWRCLVLCVYICSCSEGAVKKRTINTPSRVQYARSVVAWQKRIQTLSTFHIFLISLETQVWSLACIFRLSWFLKHSVCAAVMRTHTHCK